jgi:hypothetical protein
MHLQATPPTPFIEVANEEILNNLNSWDCVKVTQNGDLICFRRSTYRLVIDRDSNIGVYSVVGIMSKGGQNDSIHHTLP